MPASTGKFSKSWGKYWQIYLILLPAVLSYIIFSYVPMYGVTLAFREFRFDKGIFFSPWVGLKYFKEFFNYYNFGVLIRNTVIISLFKIVVFYPIPIIFALMLNEMRNRALKGLIQTISYLPHFISWVVAVIILQQFLSLDGFFNQIRTGLGLGKVFYMNDAGSFYPIMFFSYVWKSTGISSIIFLAALSGVDPNLYEAAVIDGAGRLRQIWHISLPSIAETAVIIFILGLSSILSAGWDQIYLLRTPGNMQLADILDTYIIEKGLKGGQFGYTTAVSLFQGVIGLVAVLLTNRLSRKVAGIRLF